MKLAPALLLALAGCSCGSTDASEPPFTVAAAASLTDVVEAALGTDGFGPWGGELPPAAVRAAATYGSSSTLARQLEAGAPFDVILVADERWLDRLVEERCVDPATRAVLAHGRLVVAVPAGADAGESPDAWWGRSGRWTTGDPGHVPLGRYAEEALRSAGAWDAVSPALVPAADARAALRLVERGEVEWGVLYRTDAETSERVRVVAEVDEALHSPITYSGAAAPDAPEPARTFLRDLASERGARFFRVRRFRPAFGGTDRR